MITITMPMPEYERLKQTREEWRVRCSDFGDQIIELKERVRELEAINSGTGYNRELSDRLALAEERVMELQGIECKASKLVERAHFAESRVRELEACCVSKEQSLESLNHRIAELEAHRPLAGPFVTKTDPETVEFLSSVNTGRPA